MKRKLHVHILRISFLGLLCVGILRTSGLSHTTDNQIIRSVTRPIEFNYENWILNAAIDKTNQSTLKANYFIDDFDQTTIVNNCFEQTGQINQLEAEIKWIYSNPEVEEPGKEAQSRLEQLKLLQEHQSQIAPYCETFIQNQIGSILKDLDLTFFGQPIPPVLYKISPLPVALIVSPRNEIHQEMNISLLANLTIDEIIDLEERVESLSDKSALIVPVGGVGIYPTMVMASTNLPWTLETVSHEWIHNFLTLHPLGVLYDQSSELRTINETTANIAGKEIGITLLERYYPEFIQPSPQPVSENTEIEEDNGNTKTIDLPSFDFREEMHETRVNVDDLLANGLIEKAEEYMELRRIFFWENGYQIRKINQAYFAFYGAYADSPGGAAGDDPVGSAVVELREKSDSLSEFIHTISWITSYEQLLKILDDLKTEN
ncbi:MAG: hypothetical protein JEZ06_01335 [Anaerolineaceae bacterium]|nr:hypothetical protein [Anaerolineaceae bacterium]